VKNKPMNSFVLDASALVKRYSLETGAALVDQLFTRATAARLMCLLFGAAEVAAALVRKRNGGLISPAIFAAALAQFRSELLDAASFMKLPSNNAPIHASIALVSKHSLNATDALVLRSALDLAVQFRSVGHDLVLVAWRSAIVASGASRGALNI
jgi:predicted nucleic acid-binding protein